jgi:hypothetical protein
MTTQHTNTVPSPEEERMVLDAFYGRVARTVVMLLVAAGLCALVCMVLAPAAFGALGGGLAALLLVKVAGALFLGALLTPVLLRTAFATGGHNVLAFVVLSVNSFGFMLMRPTRDAGLQWLDSMHLVLGFMAVMLFVVLRTRSRTAAGKEPKVP